MIANFKNQAPEKLESKKNQLLDELKKYLAKAQAIVG
jgi:hypothetical protein